MEKFDLVKSAMEKAVVETNKFYREKISKMEQSWTEANDMIPPNIDCLGRCHAPCDGYALSPYMDYGRNVNPDRLYAKGEFLPIPLIDDDAFYRGGSSRGNCPLRDKIKVDLELAEKITNEFAGNLYVEFKTGKSWNLNGTDVCYLYLESYVDGVFKRFLTAIRDAIENTEVREKKSYTGNAYEGRQRVKGKIVSIKEEEVPGYGYYAGSSTTNKKVFIVLDNDSTCYGNLTNWEFEVGDEIEFTATFTKANGSTHHAFYKRPHKMICINQPESTEV